jgi:hypothetical protein
MWIVITLQHISPEENEESFKKYCISNAMGETDDDMLWNGSKEDGGVRREVRALTVKVETVTLIGVCRYLMCFVH